MSMTGILRTVLRHVPDALVPGTRPEGTPAPRDGQHGHVGAPVSRLDGALKVRGEARFAAEVALEGLLYAAVVHSTIARGRIASLDTAAAEAGARRRPGDDPSQRAADEAAGSVRRGRRRGRQQPADHAGRLRALERRGGGRRAGRDAGAGRPRGGARRGDL